MEEDRLQIWVKISQQIGEMNAAMKSVLERLTNHESRITSLEHTHGGAAIKDELLVWLAKGLIAALCVIGSLTGGGALLKAVFGF